MNFKSIIGILSVSILIRAIIGLNGFSGKGVPPMHGDFEAQRHWLEITNHLPIDQWYHYDPNYWPLDYPPLTAFHSLILGKIAHWMNPNWIAFEESRGNEDESLIVFMRWTVILTELIIYISAIISLVKFVSKDKQSSLLFLILIQPGLLIIDHGHFQYNAAMLGFTTWAIVFAMKNRYLLSSLSFVCALCFKQMALFYSLAFFFYLLGVCSSLGLKRGFTLLFKIGITVVVGFALHLIPFASSLDSILQIFRRVFPFHRGLWEDKVSNVWCSLNVLVKLRNLYEIPTLAKMSAASTLLTTLPSCFLVFKRPTSKQFLYTLFTCSLSFFLFSFQVHEKSILLPCLPVTLLWMFEENLNFIILFNNVAMFSMYPLLKRDGCSLAYFVLIGVWNVAAPFLANVMMDDRKNHLKELKKDDATKTNKTGSQSSQSSSSLNSKRQSTSTFGWGYYLMQLSSFVMILWHVGEMTIVPAKRYPDIWAVLNVLWSCAHFVGFLIYGYKKQIDESVFSKDVSDNVVVTDGLVRLDKNLKKLKSS